MMHKGILTNQTTMSLDERFTQLRRGDTRHLNARIRIENRLQAATAKNRRLALQMARRPAVIAALNFRRGRGGLQRTFLGGGVSASAAMRGARFGRMISGRGNIRSLRRGQSLGRLSRSQSMQSLSVRGNMSMRGRGRGRGRLNRSGSLTRFNNIQIRRSEGIMRRGIGNYRGRGRAGGSFRRGGGFSRGRGRGGGREREIRGRGRGAGGRGRRPPSEAKKMPSKEILDKELDQYMAASRVVLDKEIDQYMNQPEAESWD